MNKFLIVFFSLILIGCSAVKNLPQVDLDKSSIQEGVFLTCNAYKTWKDCFNSAEKICPYGYLVISKEENLVMQARTLRIECKK